MACAWGGLKLMDMSIPPDDIPYFIQWELNLRAFLYAVGVAGLTGIVFGLAPALQASKADLQEALKEGGRGTAGGGRAWIRNTLVVAEVALSLLLLIGASLFVRSFLNLQTGERRLRRGAADDDALLHGERAVRDARVEGAAHRGHPAPRRGAAGRAGGVRLEPRPAQRRRRLQPDRDRGSAGREGQGARHRVHRRVAAHAEDARAVGDSRPRADRHRVDDEDAVRGRSTRRWPSGSGPTTIRSAARFRTLNEADGGWFTIVGIVPDYRHGELDNADPIEPCAYVSFVVRRLPEHRPDDPRGRRSGAGLRAGARSDPRLRSEDGRLPGRRR